MKHIIAALPLLFALACRSGADLSPAHAAVTAPVGTAVLFPRSDATPVEAPPFTRVLARPESFHGKRIQLIGFMHLEFEGNALYLSEELFRHRVTADALWLDVSSMNVAPPFSSGWVLVEGTFNGEARGHFGMYAGSLENITRLDPWHQ